MSKFTASVLGALSLLALAAPAVAGPAASAQGATQSVQRLLDPPPVDLAQYYDRGDDDYRGRRHWRRYHDRDDWRWRRFHDDDDWRWRRRRWRDRDDDDDGWRSRRHRMRDDDAPVYRRHPGAEPYVSDPVYPRPY